MVRKDLERLVKDIRDAFEVRDQGISEMQTYFKGLILEMAQKLERQEAQIKDLQNTVSDFVLLGDNNVAKKEKTRNDT